MQSQEEVKHVFVDDCLEKKKITEIQSGVWITERRQYPPYCIPIIYRITTAKLGQISHRLTHKKDGQPKYL